MRRIAFAATLALVAVPTFAIQSTPAPTTSETLTMEQIMANPDWIGHAVERAYWSADGQSIYYRLKRDGSEIRDLYRVDPTTGVSTRLSGDELAMADGVPVFDAAHEHVAYVRHGDVFVRNLAGGPAIQITRTSERESGVQWSADGAAVQYRQGNQWFSYRLSAGASMPVATLKAADNPQDKQPDALERLQLDLFKTLRHVKAEKQAQHQHELALDKADATRAPRPFWMGKGLSIVDTSLSPSGQWMVVVTQPAHYDGGKHPVVNHYVTFSGYTKPEKARPYVGRNKPAPQTAWLLDLATHGKYKLSLDALPGIHDDPLAKLRKQTQAALRKAGHDAEAKALDAPRTRSVSVTGFLMHPVKWSADGQAAAIEFRSNDNKDRWIASVDLAKHKLDVQDHLHDQAWINWNFNRFGFVPHSHTLWYLSEASGYAQLYTKAPGGKAKQLTSGHFEVGSVTPSLDGKWFYVSANKQAPYAYDVYRVPTTGGKLARITRLQAVDGFDLSPDGSRLAVLHSGAYMLSQLAVVNTDGSGERELTDTMKPAFKAIDWIQPEIVKVPSSHGAGAIYAKVWKTADYDKSASHPAVFFVHGAGYLQDVTKGWSYYFREQMFNNMLAREGYIVIDMDYRASAGYGRDWRTAIYQHMGLPELEDLLDGKTWLVKNFNVDPNRVGIYGGSYGGFMTEMALLRAPGEFAAGAALRPPSDWTSYNDLYTSDILNDPQIDPKSYKVSSPIEFAANLQDPLLICHGLIDNNVMASDSIRLYQRFIELHKKNFWLSLYPMERHAFEHPDSWYDEYRRVHELFTRFVKNRYTTGVPVAKEQATH
ncbi:MAG TPA: LpqB family beta-propeller domain-containing protein [Oleiagrimonas sp.]|nr:LpqB family beta-propeller domain-containing protein [Oleiagrimonas sp.]